MRLLFGLYLQTMLHAAKKSVSVIAGQHFLARKKIQLTKRSQRFADPEFLHEWLTRSMDQLQRLHDEFDLPHPTASDFHFAFPRIHPAYVPSNTPLVTVR